MTLSFNIMPVLTRDEELMLLVLQKGEMLGFGGLSHELSHTMWNEHRGGGSLPKRCNSWKAVSQASGMAAAWSRVSPAGMGIRSPSGTVTY